MPTQNNARQAVFCGSTLKSQVAVDEETGRVVHVADSRPGPWPDIKVLRRSGLRGLLPRGVGVLGGACSDTSSGTSS